MRKALLFCMILSCTSLFAQKVKTVSAEYTYYSPETISIEEAKRVALDRAKIQAIADEFGTIVSQSISTVITNKNGESDTQFFALGGSDVKGEWIETIGQPIFSIKYESSILAVNCKIKGRIREIAQPELELEAKVLKNGTTDNYESSDFNDGDDLFVRFKSTLNGYIIIFLLQNDVVYRLLPYKQSYYREQPVEAGKYYTFFSKSTSYSTNCIDEYKLYADNQVDAASILILYTPNQIGATPVTTGEYDEPLSMDLETFNKWLIKKRNKDIFSRIIVLPLTIKKI